MSDPLEEGLRQAMNDGAARFSPAGHIGATRSRLAGRVRRRQRRVGSMGGAALLLVSGVVVALAVGRSGNSSYRRVAAGGANRSAPITGPAGASGGPTPTSGRDRGATAVSPPESGSTPASSAAVGGRPATAVPPIATTAPAPSLVPALTVPSTTAVVPPASQVQGKVLFGPVCPVQRTPPDPACAPRPGSAHIQLVASDGTVGAQGDAGPNGQFAIPVAPGSYRVRAVPSTTTPGLGRGCVSNPDQVTVASGAMSTVAVSCDTGIR